MIWVKEGREEPVALSPTAIQVAELEAQETQIVTGGGFTEKRKKAGREREENPKVNGNQSRIQCPRTTLHAGFYTFMIVNKDTKG